MWVGSDWGDREAGKEKCLRNGLQWRQAWAFMIFSRPAKRRWTRNEAGALHTEAVRYRLSASRETKMEMRAPG